MTAAELGIKLVDTKMAITKIIGKGNPASLEQLQSMRKAKEKTIVEVGMKIQRRQSIDYFMSAMLFKAIMNNTEIPAEDRRLIAELCPNTVRYVLTDMDEKTAKSFEEIGI